MVYSGVLTKMQTEFQDPIQYYLVFKNNFIHLNQFLDKTIKIEKLMLLHIKPILCSGPLC